MRTNEEQANLILQKIEKYKDVRKKNKKILYSMISSVFCCVLVLSVVLTLPKNFLDEATITSTIDSNISNVSTESGGGYVENADSYTVFSDSQYLDNVVIDSNANSSRIIYDYDLFQNFFLDYRVLDDGTFIPSDRNHSIYLIVKGKRISTKIYCKYMGIYNNGRVDLRSFRLTKMEITDIISQDIYNGTSEYKVGDVVTVCEFFSLINAINKDTIAEDFKYSEADFIYDDMPINEKDEYLLYLRMPIEGITVGSEYYGYDKIENTFRCYGSFEINEETKKFTTKSKTKGYYDINSLCYLYPDINEKYFNIPKETEPAFLNTSSQ